MFSGTSKRFITCICIALAVLAVIGMTPSTHRQALLKPITKLYTDTDATDINAIEYSESNKVLVKPDDAQKDILNVDVDPEHPDQLLPVDNNDFEDNTNANADANADVNVDNT